MIRIVIADDEPLVSITLRTLIENLGNEYYICCSCMNGKETLDYLMSHPDVDLVITDVDMPVMDGLSLVESLDKAGKSCDVLFLSAYNNFDYVREAFHFGAVDYILKTELDEKKLKATLEKIVERRKNKSSNEQNENLINAEENRAIFFRSLSEKDSSSFPEKLINLYSKCDFNIQYPFFIMILRPGDTTDVIQRYGSALSDFTRNITSLLRQCAAPYDGDICSVDYNLYCCIASSAENLENIFIHFYDTAWIYFETEFEKKISREISSFDEFTEQYKSTVANFSVFSRPVIRAKRYIQEHYSDKTLDVQIVANYAGVSKNHLSALFSKEMGDTIVDFISRTRITAAKKLLMETDCKTFEAADRTGFSNVEVFCRVFKKITGTNPRKIRQ